MIVLTIERESKNKDQRLTGVCWDEGESTGLKLAYADLTLAVLETIKLSRQIMRGDLVLGL